MSNLILLALFIILLVAVQFTPAKTAEEVIEKYIRARGGRYRIDAVKTIYLEGTVDMSGEKAVVKIIKEQNKLSRTEIETNAGKDVELITASAVFSSTGGILPIEYFRARQGELDIAGPLTDYMAKGYKVVLTGKETIEENKCYKIKLQGEKGNEILFWIDTATFLVNQSLMIPEQNKNNGRPGNGVLTIYRNYKEVNGIKFAHNVETRAAGMVKDISFYKILLNPTIDPGMYQPV